MSLFDFNRDGETSLLEGLCGATIISALSASEEKGRKAENKPGESTVSSSRATMGIDKKMKNKKDSSITAKLLVIVGWMITILVCLFMLKFLETF